MSNIVSSWNIISELQKTPEWYHLNQKTIFYGSKRSKPGPNRSKWRFIEDFIENLSKNLFFENISFCFFNVWGCFLGSSEGFGRGFGLIRMKKWWTIFFSGKQVFFDHRNLPDRPGPEKIKSKKIPKIWPDELPARQPGRHRARIAGDPAPG